MVAAVTRPFAEGYRAQLGDNWYRVAPSGQAPINVYTKDSLATRQDDRGSPEENVLDLGYAFSRSNLTGGEGLDYYPRQSGEEGIERDKTRYWDSADVVIERPLAGEPYSLRLAGDIALVLTPTSPPADMGASRDRVYVLVGQEVHRFDDFADTTPEDTDDLGVDLVELAVALDNAVAVLDDQGDVWYKAPTTETYLKVYDHTSDHNTIPVAAIWQSKGRILAYCNDPGSAEAGELMEISPVITGTPGSPSDGGTVFTTIDTFAGAITDIIDAGHAIVAGFTDGSLRSYVPQTDTAGGVPVLTIRGRTNVPFGEVPYRLSWNLGTVLVFTVDLNNDHARIYSAQVLDERFDFVVGQLQFLRMWVSSGETAPQYTSNATSTRDAIYFWMAETATTRNLWRFDLVTGGLSRQLTGDTSWGANPKGLVIVDGVITWIVEDSVYHQSDTLRSEGYVITPNITFGLNTPINWTSFVMEINNLATAGCRVDLYRSSVPTAITDPDDPSWILVQTFTDPAQSGVEVTKVNITANTLALKLVLHRSTTGTVSPEVARFAVRGFPKHRDWVAEVPINISDYVEAPYRMPLHVPGHGDTVYSTLTGQQGESTLLTLLDPPTVIRGVVDNILAPVAYVSPRGSQGRYAVLVFRGQKISDTSGSSVSSGTAGVGVGIVGVSTVGVGNVEE